MAKGLKFTITAVDKTQRAFSTLKNNVRKLDKNLGKVGLSLKGLGITAAVAFGVQAVKKVLSFGDSINKLSIRLGITEESLSRLAHVATISGIEFEGLSKNVQKMVGNISDASTGIGTAKAALDELGLSATALNQMTPEQQLGVLADALDGVQNSADRVRLAVDIFGERGANMLQIFEGGSATINKLTAEADALGATMSGPQAKAMADINDAGARMSASFMGIVKTIVSSMAPAIIWIIDLFTKLFVTIGKVGSFVSEKIDQMGLGFVYMAEKLGLVDEGIADLAAQELFENMNKDVKKLNINLEKTGLHIEKIKAGTKKPKKEKTDAKEDAELPWKTGESGLKDFETQAKSTASIFQDTFKTAIGSINSDFSNLKDVAKDAFNSIVSGLAQQGVSSLMGSLGGSIGGGTGGAIAGLASTFAGFFADGGTIKPGQWGVVGERGPELVQAGASSMNVTPNGGGTGGRPISVNFNISTPSPDSFRKSQGQITAQAAQAIRSAGRNL